MAYPLNLPPLNRPAGLILTPACIDDELLRRAFCCGIRSQEQSHIRNVFRKHARLQTLTVHDLLFDIGRIPQLYLAFGPGRPRRQSVNSYTKATKISSQSPGQPEHSSLTRVVNGEVRQLESPSNRTKIDNCTPTEALHLRKDRLSCEEHVSQVDGNPFIPVRGHDFVDFVAVVVTCVVDEDADITQVDPAFFDGSLQRGNIA